MFGCFMTDPWFDSWRGMYRDRFHDFLEFVQISWLSSLFLFNQKYLVNSCIIYTSLEHIIKIPFKPHNIIKCFLKHGVQRKQNLGQWFVITLIVNYGVDCKFAINKQKKKVQQAFITVTFISVTSFLFVRNYM
jgi:hypothetical protein